MEEMKAEGEKVGGIYREALREREASVRETLLCD